MALQTIPRPPLVRLSQYPSKPSSHKSLPSSSAQLSHKRAFAPALRDLPAAANAMRLTRHTRSQLPRTVYILDWDDTCCATSFLERSGVMADLDIRLDQCAPQLHRYLRLLEHHVLSLLKSAVRLGTVLIVTNAGDGWVELSSTRFLPAVRAFLDANYKSIKIVSARARYVETYRHHPLQWKALTFNDELQTIMSARPCNPYELHVVVLGDSMGDQYAAHATANSLAAAGMPIVLKVVKFLERPSIDQLCKELAVLLDNLYTMTEHKGPFDVCMYKEPHPNDTQPIQHHQQQQQHTMQHHHPGAFPEALPADVNAVPSVAACAAVV